MKIFLVMMLIGIFFFWDFGRDFDRGLGLVGDLEGGCNDFHWDI